MCAYTHVYLYIFMCTCMCRSMCAYMCIYMYTYPNVYTYLPSRTFIYTRIREYPSALSLGVIYQLQSSKSPKYH